MTDDPTPDHEPGHGPDDPDLEHPLTADDIINQAAASLSEGRSGSDTQAGRLVALALARFRLVNGDDGRLYAIAHDGPAIPCSLRGTQGLRSVLADLYYDLHGQPAGGSAMTDALAVIEARAARAEREPVALRVTGIGPHAVALDLGTSDGRCVLVDETGWRLADRAPVLLRRSVLTGPLPTTRAGSLDPLAGLVNVDDAGFRLIVGWLVAALVPEIPHPILALVGEQGTAKSTAARLVVSLIDPSPAPLRTPPRELRSWAASASASWIVALDNVSVIPPWLSDTLCKAVTGDGIVERVLHTDDGDDVEANAMIDQVFATATESW
jgi:hypothetical protein